MAEEVITNFASIFSYFEIFSAIWALAVAPPSDDFQICAIHWKVFSEKTL